MFRVIAALTRNLVLATSLGSLFLVIYLMLSGFILAQRASCSNSHLSISCDSAPYDAFDRVLGKSMLRFLQPFCGSSDRLHLFYVGAMSMTCVHAVAARQHTLPTTRQPGGPGVDNHMMQPAPSCQPLLACCQAHCFRGLQHSDDWGMCDEQRTCRSGGPGRSGWTPSRTRCAASCATSSPHRAGMRLTTSSPATGAASPLGRLFCR